MSDEEFLAGYMDGRDPDAPEPSENRSNRYRHSEFMKTGGGHGPTVTYSTSAIWPIFPMGHGVTAVTTGVTLSGEVAVLFKAVPDTLIRANWKTAGPRPKEEREQLLTDDGPRCGLLFADRGAIDRFIAQLQSVKEKMGMGTNEDTGQPKD